jgi:hypothetical protein
MDQLAGLIVLVVFVGAFALLSGGRSATEMRMKRRWDSSFDAEIRRVQRTDATGVLRCRSCGAAGSERAGRCADGAPI